MAANTNPVFIASPKVTAVSFSSGSTPATDRLGTAGTNTLYTAGANGSRIDKLRIRSTGASASLTTSSVAGLVQVYLFDGTTKYLFDEIAISASTPSSTAAAQNSQQSNLATDGSAYAYLPSGWSLLVAITVAQAINVTAIGGDY